MFAITRSVKRSLLKCLSLSSQHAAQAQHFASAVPIGTAQRQNRSWKRILLDFNKLAKGKLSLIVVSTAGAGFILGSGESIDWWKLGWTCYGTWACSAAANTCNQIFEVENDSRMRRTMLRPLPAGRLSLVSAVAFAAATGLTGAFALQTQANPLTAGLGVANIALYASIYTPLKQLHPINTWVGALVGAIPPLMGWTAATGSLDPGSLFLGSVLYFWQLPHFMALAWLCKEDYIRGGYQMLSRFDATGRRTAAVALRNSAYLLPLGIVAVSAGLLQPGFVYESFALSAFLAVSASAFYTRPCPQTARLMFRASLIHLPLYMLFAILHRVPMTEPLTWEQMYAYLLKSVEGAEREIYVRAHGAEFDKRCGSMLFPFSPPVLLPPPLPMVKQSAINNEISEQFISSQQVHS